MPDLCNENKIGSGIIIIRENVDSCRGCMNLLSQHKPIGTIIF